MMIKDNETFVALMKNLEHSLTKVTINNPLLICKYGDNNDVFIKQD